MIARLKISNNATGLVSKMYTSLGQLYTPNIILRNALAHSISNGDKYDGEKLNFLGSEFQMSTLLGEEATLYKLLVDEYYGKKLNDEEYKTILVFHFEKGMRDENFRNLFG